MHTISVLNSTFSTARAASALEFLNSLDDGLAASAYTYARADLAAQISAAMVWSNLGEGILATRYRDVVIHKDVSGYRYGSSASPVWGVVYLGTHRFKVYDESAVLAYLMARYHSVEIE